MYLGGKRHAHACLIVLMPSLDSSFAWRAWWRAAGRRGHGRGPARPCRDAGRACCAYVVTRRQTALIWCRVSAVASMC
jgi:hypothetical protein